MDLPSFSLEQFQGPLDLLIYLIQKEEIDVREIPLKEVTAQFAQKEDEQIDVKAETLTLAASLLLMKSRSLIPHHSEDEEEEIDDRTQLIAQLIEYCRFKEAAKELQERETSQLNFFPRSAPEVVKPTDSGLEAVSLQGLSESLKQVLDRFEKHRGKLEDDTWHVTPKILWIKELLQKASQITFERLFDTATCQEEVIVIFLALLELMKEGDAHIEKEEGEILIYA